MVTDAGGFVELAPERVAVVLVDLQNDFCSPDAATPPTNTHNAAAARRANEFAAAAADAGAHIVYTRQILDPDRLTPRQRRWERPGGLCAAGSWGRRPRRHRRRARLLRALRHPRRLRTRLPLRRPGEPRLRPGPGDTTDNRAVRDYLRHNRPGHLLPSAAPILGAWRGREAGKLAGWGGMT